MFLIEQTSIEIILLGKQWRVNTLKCIGVPEMISIDNLGDGQVMKIGSGETVFRLDSYEKNPIV